MDWGTKTTGCRREPPHVHAETANLNIMKTALVTLALLLLHTQNVAAQAVSPVTTPAQAPAPATAAAPAAATDTARAATEPTTPTAPDGPEAKDAKDETSDNDFPDKGWLVSAGGTATLTEGNSSTRVFGVQLDADRESFRYFVGIEGSARYGKTRVVSIVPDPRGETEAIREGRPGGSFEENINDWLLSNKYGRYLSDRRSHYIYTLASVESDRFRGFWIRSQGQLGYGYRLANERLSAKVEAGLDFTEDHQVVGSIRSRLSLAANMLIEYVISDTLTLRENFSHVRTLETNILDVSPLEDHRTRSNTSFQVKLTDNFDLRTSAILDYASVPAPGAHKTDIKFTTAVLYSIL